jgi:lysozyme-like protein
MHPLDACSHLFRANFRYGKGIVIALATFWAESDLREKVTGPPNTDGSVDRGWVQINSKAHAAVPDSCAYDGACAAKQAWSISKKGTSFTPWSAFTSGRYREHMVEARYVVAVFYAIKGLGDEAGLREITGWG